MEDGIRDVPAVCQDVELSTVQDESVARNYIQRWRLKRVTGKEQSQRETFEVLIFLFFFFVGNLKFTYNQMFLLYWYR